MTLDEARRDAFSDQFVKYMENRILTSSFKYGLASKNAKKADYPACIKEKVDRYLATGNTEWLIDAANYAMLEFMYPQHADAHFRATDSNESTGVKMRDGSTWHGAGRGGEGARG